MTKHTPGPWDRHFETKECKQSRRKWRVDYITATTRDHYTGRGLVNYIAEVNGQCDSDTSANARLIAAAPELLAALEAIFAPFNSGDKIELHNTDDQYHAARAAIAKAKGA